MILALCTMAFAEDSKPYYTMDTNTLATSSNVELNYIMALEPTVKDGKQVAPGHAAYYDLKDLGKFVIVDSLAKADLVVYSDAAMEKVALYLDKVKVPEFYDAKVYNNFGTKCGQCNYETTKGVTYYAVDGKFLYAGDKNGEWTLRVDGKLVSVIPVGEIALVDHIAVPVLENNEIVGYKCANCSLAAVKAPNAMSIPEGAVIITGNWYFPVAAATPVTSGVASAKTFDAGIAMYVGLALMSVTGSTAVIGKKKN